jgi:2-dehydro-3-deoxyphosphogalactonate aldolase
MFPAEQLGPAVLKAWRAVIPGHIPLVPVGGITPERIAEYARAGATGFGLGSALYKPGMTANDVEKTARAFIKAWHDAYPKTGKQS